MYTINSGPFTLACHPQKTSQAIREIEVAVSEKKNGSLMLRYRLAGDISVISIQEPRSPRRADQLWQHTCFEVFVMAGEGPAYREFNFSPSGEWAVYDFRAYRNAKVLETERSPETKVYKDTHRLELVAEIPRGLLPRGHSLRLGLSAIIEDVDAILSYWALWHPPGRPDFHHPDAFALQMRNPE